MSIKIGTIFKFLAKDKISHLNDTSLMANEFYTESQEGQGVVLEDAQQSNVQTEKQTIVFTGGGTAGHVTPNITLIKYYQNQGLDIVYIGSAAGVERELIKPLGIKYYPIASGKLRRYLSVQNFIDPFKILLGTIKSYFLLGNKDIKLVFSKGGFVAFPVVFAAWLRRIPVIAHESDFSPGLANKLCFPFVNKLCVNFESVTNHFAQKEKVTVTGTPIRQELLAGDKDTGLKICGLTAEKPCILVMGGSLGAQNINVCLRQALDKLLDKFQVIHLCGKGKVDISLQKEGYCQLEYVSDDLGHIFKASDIIISRAGANSVFEILALNKAHIFIPLSRKYSRGDQIQNAHYFKEKGISSVLEEENLTPELLFETINDVFACKKEVEIKIKNLNIISGTEKVIEVINAGLSEKNSRQK